MKIKFGTDGWRGIIGEDFTFANVRKVSQAIADFLKKKGAKRVVVGYDSRFLSSEFAFTVSSVLNGNDIEVDISSVIVPTPVISFTTRYGNYDLGIMITASHNPYKFNGLKIKTKEGGAADESLTGEIEKFLGKSKVKLLDVKEAEKKNLLRRKDFTKRYVDFLKSFVDIKRIKKMKLKVLLDLMYGAGGFFSQKILSGSQIKIDYLHKEYNPSFGGIHPEPVEENLKELIKKVKKDKYDLGVALDGDGDRIALVTSSGRFINAQIILPLLAIHMIRNRGENLGIGKTVVGSNLIDEVAISLGVSCFETPVGFKYISDLMISENIVAGGEEAGGMGLQDYIPERDGTLAGLLLLEMMVYQKKNLKKLVAEMEKEFGRYYYQRCDVKLSNGKCDLKKFKALTSLLGKKVVQLKDFDGAKLICEDGSWLMLRPSGTEPLVRAYSEAKTLKRAKDLIRYGETLLRNK